MKPFKLHAPNLWVLIIATILAIFGLWFYLPIPRPPMTGIDSTNAFWFIFLGWLLLALGNLFTPR